MSKNTDNFKLLTALPASALCTRCEPGAIPWADSTAIEKPKQDLPPQPRALLALKLALAIDDPGYNIYLAGGQHLGRTYMVRSYLAARAAKAKTPPDAVYLYNEDDPDKPLLLEVKAGLGRELRTTLRDALAALKREIPKRFEADATLVRRDALNERFQSDRDTLFRTMEGRASREGFEMEVDETGAITLYPLVEGKVLREAEVERLAPEAKTALRDRAARLMGQLNEYLREADKQDKTFQDEERALDQELTEEALKAVFDPPLKALGTKIGGPRTDARKRFDGFVTALRKTVIDEFEQFLPRPELPLSPFAPPDPQGPESDVFQRFEANLFVDNSSLTGAPIIVEDHPTAANLLGCIERQSEMGALVTDHTLAKAGSLHRARGGYLILHVEDILSIPAAWEGLLRALRSGKAKIEDPEAGESTRTKTIEPEPMPTQVKVVLIGTDEDHEMFLIHEDRFPKLFKIKAHLRSTTDRTPAAIKDLVRSLGTIIEREGLPPFSREALARLVDFASRLAEDQKKLSLRYPLLRELMIEAAAFARMKRAKLVDETILQEAQTARDFRANLYEEEFLEEYDRELIRVGTEGARVGRVNGLSVTMFGDHEFGLPHEIACTVGVGQGGIVDLEREADLGGPIHTKAMMILKSYLLKNFAHDKPLTFAGSINFEQSYAHIEGDSASGAELAAILSALADVPITRSLALTGAVSSSGEILAVGGVTRKIEGFFEVCRRRGLTGEQGVILPHDNRDQLMLSDDVLEAVEADQFAVHAVTHIDQAMALLTGMDPGTRDATGRFPTGSLYRKVDDRLAELHRLAKTGKE